MTVIAIANQKGGVGKTTLAVAAAEGRATVTDRARSIDSSAPLTERAGEACRARTKAIATTAVSRADVSQKNALDNPVGAGGIGASGWAGRAKPL